MKRISFFLTTLQWDRLQRLVHRTGMSLSEHVRRAIDAYLSAIE